MSSMVQRISFSNLVSNSEGVRVAQLMDTPYMSIRDIIMSVCEKDNNQAGEVWRRLSDEYKNELA